MAKVTRLAAAPPLRTSILKTACCLIPPGVFVGHDALDKFAGDLRATHPHFVYTHHGEPQALHNGGILAWGSGPKGEGPDYTGLDVVLFATARSLRSTSFSIPNLLSRPRHPCGLPLLACSLSPHFQTCYRLAANDVQGQTRTLRVYAAEKMWVSQTGLNPIFALSARSHHDVMEQICPTKRPTVR